MDDDLLAMTDSLFASIAGSFAAACAVTGIFWKYEDTAGPQLKAKVTEWLRFKGNELQKPSVNWHLAALLDGFFGPRLVSAQAFVRSFYASLAAVATMTFIWSAVRPSEFHAFAYHAIEFAIFFVMAMVGFSSIPDFFSYAKSRLIIRKMWQTNSVSALFGFAFFDFLLSLSIVCAGVFVVVIVTDTALWLLGEPRDELSSQLAADLAWFTRAETVKMILTFGSNRDGGPTLAIFFYASLLVPIWALLYALSATLIKTTLRWYPRVSSKLSFLFDVDAHPIRSVGVVAGVVVFLALVIGSGFKHVLANVLGLA